MDVASKKFLADEDAKGFMSSGDAVWSFFQDFLFKYMRQSGPRQWYRVLDYVKPGSQTEKDTAWLLQKMARVTTAAHPDAPGDAPAPLGAGLEERAESRAVRIVQETHAALTSSALTAHSVNRCSHVQANPGGDGSKSSKHRSRAEFLQDAIAEFPYLLRRAPEDRRGSVKFLRRPVDVGKMMAVLEEAGCCAGVLIRKGIVSVGA